jgi:hypothetical protein
MLFFAKVKSLRNWSSSLFVGVFCFVKSEEQRLWGGGSKGQRSKVKSQRSKVKGKKSKVKSQREKAN